MEPNTWPQSDAPGHDQPQPDTAGQSQPAVDQAQYSLTVEEAAGLFATAGVPRSLRTLRRFCQQGELTCVSVQTEHGQQYLLDRVSVDRKIKEIQQVLETTRRTQAGYVRTQPAMTGHIAGQGQPRPDATGEPETARETPEQKKKIETLEREVIELRIDKAARDRIIQQLTEDRKEFLNVVMEQSRQIGTLETNLLQLQAPKVVHTEPAPEVVAPTPEPAPAPEPASPPTPEKPEPERRSLLRRVFGG